MSNHKSGYVLFNLQPQTICIKCVIRIGLFLCLCKTNEILYCYFIDKTRCNGVVQFPVEYCQPELTFYRLYSLKMLPFIRYWMHLSLATLNTCMRWFIQKSFWMKWTKVRPSMSKQTKVMGTQKIYGICHLSPSYTKHIIWCISF